MYEVFYKARELDCLKQPIVPAQISRVYQDNLNSFQHKPRDERQGTQAIQDFFSDVNVVKRCRLHQQHINCSQII